MNFNRKQNKLILNNNEQINTREWRKKKIAVFTHFAISWWARPNFSAATFKKFRELQLRGIFRGSNSPSSAMKFAFCKSPSSWNRFTSKSISVGISLGKPFTAITLETSKGLEGGDTPLLFVFFFLFFCSALAAVGFADFLLGEGVAKIEERVWGFGGWRDEKQKLGLGFRMGFRRVLERRMRASTIVPLFRSLIMFNIFPSCAMDSRRSKWAPKDGLLRGFLHWSP